MEKELQIITELMNNLEDYDVKVLPAEGGYTLTFTKDSCKTDFENWIKSMDDDLFQEILESLSENIVEISEKYNSNPKEIISEFENKAEEIIGNKIEGLQEEINELQAIIEDAPTC